MRQLHLVFVCLLLSVQQLCNALAQHSKIVSRKSDGQYKTYSFGNVDGGNADCNDGRELEIDDKQHFFRPSAALRRVQSSLRSTFLPDIPSNQRIGANNGGNYQSDYLRYIIYDNIQDLSTSLRSVLATQRILEGLGVGRAGATALSATLNFLIRDGCGMVASLLFTSYAARGFRRNVKRWKYFADIMVSIGITLEIVAPSVLAYPLLSKWFLPLLCLGNICKALCGVAAGACGGSLQMYWAVKLMGTEEGISEVAAKGGAQRTVVGGAGLVLAALLAKWLGNCGVRTAVLLYIGLTIVHLLANYRSLKLVALDWFNGWRLHFVVEEFFGCMKDKDGSISGQVNEGSILLSNPMEVSRREPLVFLPESRSREGQTSKYPIRMGVSFNEFSKLSSQLSSIMESQLLTEQSQRNDNYILTVGAEQRFKSKRSILVSYFSNSSNSEKAKAYLHSFLVRRALVHQLARCKEGYANEVEMVRKAEDIAQADLVHFWPIFERCVSAAGWKLDKTECHTEGYEMDFE